MLHRICNKIVVLVHDNELFVFQFQYSSSLYKGLENNSFVRRNIHSYVGKPRSSLIMIAQWEKPSRVIEKW